MYRFQGICHQFEQHLYRGLHESGDTWLNPAPALVCGQPDERGCISAMCKQLRVNLYRFIHPLLLGIPLVSMFVTSFDYTPLYRVCEKVVTD